MTDDFIVNLKDYIRIEHKYPREAWCDPDDVQAALDEIERLKNQISHIIEQNNPQIENANSYFKSLEEELARCNKIIDEYEEEHIKLRASLEEKTK